MIREIRHTSGMTELIYIDECSERKFKLYARDLLAEIKLIAVTALFIFGVIFAVPMVRHEAFYIMYWTLTAAFTFRVLWQRYGRKKKKNRKTRANLTAQK